MVVQKTDSSKPVNLFTGLHDIYIWDEIVTFYADKEANNQAWEQIGHVPVSIPSKNDSVAHYGS